MPWKPRRAGNDEKCWRLQCIAHRWERLHAVLAALAVSTQKATILLASLTLNNFEFWIYSRIVKVLGFAGQTCKKRYKSRMVWVYYWAEPDYIVCCQATMHGAAAHPIAGGCSKTIILAKKKKITAQTSSPWEEAAISVSLNNRSHVADTRRIFKIAARRQNESGNYLQNMAARPNCLCHHGG